MSRKVMMTGSPGDVLTTPEAAAVKGVHRNSVLKAIRKGYLEARKSGKSWIIDRRSLERWEPKGHGLQPNLRSKDVEFAAMPAAREVEAQRRKRNKKLLHVLDEWLADESSDDEEAWPALQTLLEENRLSSRPLFKAMPQ